MIDIRYGHIKLESRERREGDSLIGEGRCKTYDVDGKLINVTDWEPTGIRLLNAHLLDPVQPSRWWKFWK